MQLPQWPRGFEELFSPFSLTDLHFLEGWAESSGQSEITEPQPDIKTCFLQLVGELVNIFNLLPIKFK